jgi:hypothetical protein
VFPRVPLNISLRTQFLYYNLVEAFGGTPGITGELIMHHYQRLGKQLFILHIQLVLLLHFFLSIFCSFKKFVAN